MKKKLHKSYLLIAGLIIALAVLIGIVWMKSGQSSVYRGGTLPSGTPSVEQEAGL